MDGDVEGGGEFWDWESGAAIAAGKWGVEGSFVVCVVSCGRNVFTVGMQGMQKGQCEMQMRRVEGGDVTWGGGGGMSGVGASKAGGS
jgi:hypothetical protein